jgi:uncharacterized protein (DUF2062 family)
MSSNSDQIKLLIKNIEMIEKAAKIMPAGISFFVALTLIFDVISFFEGNIVVGIILSILVLFGLYLLLRIYQTRKRRRKGKSTARNINNNN